MRYLTLLLVCFIHLHVSAQTGLNQLKEKADELFETHQYPEALELYKKVIKELPASGAIYWHMGLCQMHSQHQEKALPYFEKAQNLGFDRKQVPHINQNIHQKYTSEDLDFNLAICYHLHHKFDLAIEHYNKYESKMDQKHKKIHDRELKIVERMIQMAENGKELMKAPLTNIAMENIGPNINSNYPDYTPLIPADESFMIFTSRRPGSTGREQDEDDDNLFMEDIYISKNHSGEWSKARPLSRTINTEHHDACLGLSPDGNLLFIYRDNNHGSGDIYVSERTKEDWSEPKMLHHHINTLHFEASASISDDGTKLFFVSDRKGGSGQKDIYMATRNEEGEWTHPVNCGTTINTEYNEESPFISHDGLSLYFSSKGHNSMGGYDIFKSTWNEESKSWEAPVNIGYPINTADDDLFYVVSTDGKRAYFSTHHEDSLGDKDIYRISFK